MSIILLIERCAFLSLELSRRRLARGGPRESGQRDKEVDFLHADNHDGPNRAAIPLRVERGVPFVFSSKVRIDPEVERQLRKMAAGSSCPIWGIPSPD